MNAHRTGSATSERGGFANSGIVIGDVTVAHWAAAHSSYRLTVERIAPKDGLVGRDRERAELAAFCTADEAPGYVWWRAPAWAGKSALMATFVLRPPPGVRIVSFFITARFASQSDRHAFLTVVVEQLAALLGLPMPSLEAATAEAQFGELLDQAAALCRERGERLVLVVDGLDEDRGATTDGHSIAAMLPSTLRHGLRVVVAGRPNPPIPSDVPDEHPLRSPEIVRPLHASAYAAAVRADMERELDVLLESAGLGHDLLGLLTAANGGLSVADLVHLTKAGPRQVGNKLMTVTGRSFTDRESVWAPGERPPVFILGHEELQATAERFLGEAELGHYRARLHDWAAEFRGNGWPPDTPEYLLLGYFELLKARGDTDEMIKCATDATRHDRMLDLSGGDTSALAEITSTLTVLASRREPELYAVARLAMHRDRLVDRNTRIPPLLPALWATLGNPTRAENLARSTSTPLQQWRALREVARVAAAAGMDDVVDQILESVSGDYARGYVLGDAARASAAAGRFLQGYRWARQVTLPDLADQALGAVLRRVPAAHFGWAEPAADAIVGSTTRAGVQLAFVRARLAAGDIEAAHQLIGSTDDITTRNQAKVALVQAIAVSGDLVRAIAVSAELPPVERAKALVEVLRAAATTGRRAEAIEAAELAHQLIRGFARDRHQVEALLALVRAAAPVCEARWAANLWAEAEVIALSITDHTEHDLAVVAVARAAVANGDFDGARRLAAALREHLMLPWSVKAVVQALAQAGEFGHAEAVATAVADPGDRAAALAVLAGALYPHDHSGATNAVRRAVVLVASLDGLRHQMAMVVLARELTLAGLWTQAETVIDKLESADDRLTALTRMAFAMSDRRPEQARQVLMRVERLARTIPEPTAQNESRSSLAEAWSIADHRSRAEQLALTITADFDRQATLEKISHHRVDANDLTGAWQTALLITEKDRTEHIHQRILEHWVRHGAAERACTAAAAIEHPGLRSRALTTLVRLLARAEPVRAELLISKITDPISSIEAYMHLHNYASPADKVKFVLGEDIAGEGHQ
ncbi:hypothetical protein, partial [Amycolatopsis lurida]|uniref:hypothetical protein n=1 Tax=Amycolatopsis lurida TaxID=31959 RepID=UPI0036621B18